MEGRRIILFFLVFTNLSFADDMGQMLMDQGSVDTYEEIKSSKKTPFLSGEVEEYTTDKNNKKSANNPNQFLLGTFENRDSYLEHENKEIVSSVYRNGVRAFQFSYIQDSYTYTDSNDVFTKTYESEDGHRYGFLHFGGEYYFNRNSSFKAGWGVQTGLGLNQGKGIFVTGAVSDANFTLWTIPLDILLNIEIPLGRRVHVQLNGGPSAVLLIQNRSDREDYDRDKSRRQFGYGFTYGGKLKFNLSQISKDIGFKMYRDYDISNFYINLEARAHDYSGFKEEGVGISGASFGLGFTFEYL